MKHQYFRVLIGIVLILGLCSCKSENSEDLSVTQKDPFNVNGVDYVHKDKSIHNINDTKELSIDSTIQLNMDTSRSTHFDLKAQSECYGGSLKKNAHHEQTWKNKSSLAVTALVPLEVFQPLQNEDNQIFCDFNMEVTNSEGSETTIELKDIRITNLYGFYNQNIMGSDASKTPFFILENQLDRTLDIPFIDSKIHLFCDDNWNTFKSENSKTHFGLIKEYDFLQNEINFCRIVFESLDERQRNIGRYFYLQKEATNVSLSLTMNLPNAKKNNTKINIDFNNQSVAWLNIHNIGKAKAYIDINSLGHTDIEMLSHYAKGEQANIAYHNNRPLKLRATWFADSGVIIKTSGNNKYLVIPPGESHRLKAVTSGRLSCGTGDPHPVASSNYCSTVTQFHGYLVNFYGMPVIKVNKFSSFKHFDWNSIAGVNTLPGHSFMGGNFQFWKANPDTPEVCKGLININKDFPKVTQTFISESPLHGCQIN